MPDNLMPWHHRTRGHSGIMRSTVRIDDDLMAELRARARAERLSMTRLLNRVLWAGLAV